MAANWPPRGGIPRLCILGEKVAATDLFVTGRADQTGKTVKTGKTGKTVQGMTFAVAARRRLPRELATHMS
ncbi:hypothetical protein QR685DRAFT_440620 [Neurospora intermedia]|uniref:Uncharacterized protein n=1 Tax=Neurospora intermedia TaxID=5142 RepID=A0ABR3DBS7_NEUIN